MSWENPKTNWGQLGQTVPGVDDFNRIEGNIDILGKYDRAPGYGTATGTNAKSITLSPAPGSYYEGLCFAFKNATQNTGAVTINVNGLGAKSVKKPNGNDVVAGFLKAGSIYTIRYNGTNFILQGSDSTGDAMPEHVLAGKTFSNDDGEQVGSMINRSGNNIQSLLSEDVIIPEGFYSGAEKVIAPSVQAGDIGFTEWLSGYVFSTSWTKKLGYVVGISGVYRVSFDLRNNATYETAFARIYVNDSPRGIERSVRGDTPITYTENITANAGDEIQLYARSSSSSQPAIIGNFKLTTNTEICVGKTY